MKSGRIPTREELNRKAIRNILIVITAGFFMLISSVLIDIFIDNPSLTHGGDGLYITRPDTGRPGHISLEAEVATGRGKVKESYDITIDPYSVKGNTVNPDGNSGRSSFGKMSKEELTAYELRNIISSLNDDTSKHRVFLPDSLPDGKKVSWNEKSNSNAAPVAFAVLLLTVFIYRSRLAPLRRLEQSRQESITRQLPEFVNRLVLLLNAGLVLNSAFEKAVEESSRLKNNENDYFYMSMRSIYASVHAANSSMSRGFREFAKSRSTMGGDVAKELMRISNIISDNISKGVELTEKLQSESEMLWLNRKRNCEERGRLAETKLTLPLTVFLLVLIVITVSPALLEL